ncbi:type 1 fimbrial protein [Aurantiacibacter odishensis]|uniref:type 1 fimbrial protein n=1 Tax=Aurantiacibacter odishensis TaxID=1155476 RepID=UPI000E71CB3C|nr:type 1 fimbrial protein [Aurantiacibacter odishensis]
MKKVLLATAATALFSGTAFAQATDTVEMTVSASVAQECSVEQPDNVNFGQLAINQDPGEEALLLTQGRISDYQDIWISCNYGANMALAATSMVNQDQANDGPDAADFSDTIPYRMELNNSAGVNSTVFNRMSFDTLTNSGDNKTNTDAFHDQASLLLRYVPRPDLRPLAGNYLGTASITVGGV